MKIDISTQSYLNTRADGLLVFTTEEWKPEVAEVDRLLQGALVRSLARQKYRGKAGEVAVLDTHGKTPAEIMIIAGGSDDGFKMRRSILLALRKARESGVEYLCVRADGFSPERLEMLSHMVVLSLYNFDKYKKPDDTRKDIDHVRLLVGEKSHAVKAAVHTGEVEAHAVCYARDLVNEPAGVVTPSYLASRAIELARGQKWMRCRVFDRKWMERQGMGGVLGVARGSREEPRFIVMHYRSLRPRKRLAIVGKGITFDSGGLSLKANDHMMAMKCDMSGAATVLGIFSALADLNPSVDIIGVIPATENMPGGAAYKPGDILRMMNGKTVEILNTDAEGRLILADALVYAEQQKPDWIIDLATLTSACVIALGDNCAGLMSTDEVVKRALLKAAAEAGERVWELPLIEEYKETLKSEVADLKNSNYGREGGAIKAGLFLNEFVKSTPWAHLDIAGPAFLEKEIGPNTKGGTGHGVGTLLRLIRSF